MPDKQPETATQEPGSEGRVLARTWKDRLPQVHAALARELERNKRGPANAEDIATDAMEIVGPLYDAAEPLEGPLWLMIQTFRMPEARLQAFRVAHAKLSAALSKARGEA